MFSFAQLAPAEKMAAFCLTEPSSGSDAGVHDHLYIYVGNGLLKCEILFISLACNIHCTVFKERKRTHTCTHVYSIIL